jgi:hypothetical protein
MGLFSFKKKVVREISGGAWGHLVSDHHFTVDTLSRSIRCVEKEGFLDEKKPVTFLRVFNLQEVEKKGVEIKGWETFDQYPELLLFEGYLTKTNEAFLKPKQTNHLAYNP